MPVDPMTANLASLVEDSARRHGGRPAVVSGEHILDHATLDNLARLCRWHHYQKSHLGYRYRGGPGTWTWIPPDQPTDPPHLPP